MTDAIDYQAVVADLKTRRLALDQLIASVEALILGQGEPGAVKLDGVASGGNGLSASIHPDTFYGLSLIDAAKKFLRLARRAQHTAAIADAIGKGGLKRPDVNVLSSILVRAAKGREITKVGKGMWGLAEWYPKAPKESEERPRAARKRRPKKEGRARSQAKKDKKPRVGAPQAPIEDEPRKTDGASMDVTLDVLRSAGEPLHADEIVKRARKLGLEAARLPIEGYLGRQAKAGKVQKTGKSTYAIAG